MLSGLDLETMIWSGSTFGSMSSDNFRKLGWKNYPASLSTFLKMIEELGFFVGVVCSCINWFLFPH